MNKIWKCEVRQDPKTKKTTISNIWRPTIGGLHLRIAAEAAPKDVREALLLTDEHGEEPWDDGKPFIFDFRKLKRSAGKSGEFFKRFEYERHRRKFDKDLVATATFEMPMALGYGAYRGDDDHATVEQLLSLGQEIARETVKQEFPRGLQDTFDKCQTQDEADRVITNVKPTRREAERYKRLCQLAGMKFDTATDTWETGCYCAYCGNIHVLDRKLPCTHCGAVLNHELSIAWEAYKTLQAEHRQCCGGLSSGKDHLYFHGKHWDSVYPTAEMRKKKGWKGCSTTAVEMGVALYKEHVRTYWIFDNDSTTESQEYGDEIVYYDVDFWKKLDRQLDQAAEEAWNSDVCSCEHCGYHYHVGNGPCGCSASETDNENEEDDE